MTPDTTPSPSSGIRLSPTAKVWLLAFAIAALGLGVGALRSNWWISQPLPINLQWWMLAPLFAASEVFVIHYQLRRQQYSFTLSELPLVLGIFFASWPAIVVARLVGGAFALRFVR